MFKPHYIKPALDNIQHVVWMDSEGQQVMGIRVFSTLIGILAERYADGGPLPQEDEIQVTRVRVEDGNIVEASTWDHATLQDEIYAVAAEIDRERKERAAHEAYERHQAHYI